MKELILTVRPVTEEAMLALEDALSRAYQDRIRRYQRLLKSHLTEFERTYVQTRFAEQKAARQSLFAQRSRLTEILNRDAI